VSKNITILGYGKTGQAVAAKLKTLGYNIFISESNPGQAEFKSEFGGHTLAAIEKADLIVVSPGIHLDIPVLEEAKKRKIPIVSEIELAFSFIKKPIIAVTGTNGKTTTTTLIGEMLKAAGKQTSLAGNIGFPLIAVDDSRLDYIVCEVSSYQLEAADKFKPFIGVILNIQPDHIERHGSMEEYINQKKKIFASQVKSDFLVYNQDDPQVVQMIYGAKAAKVGFSLDNLTILGINPEEMLIPGKHNLSNALAAANAARLCGVNEKTIGAVLKTFPGVEHRIELVREIKGIKFYNDSKATNPDSTMVALESFPGQPIILILGGRDKGTSLDQLCETIHKHVKQVVLVGEASQRFKAALEKSRFNKHLAASSFKQAIDLAYRSASAGDIILLSPACASFDMFANFEERGRVFKDYVQEIKI